MLIIFLCLFYPTDNTHQLQNTRPPTTSWPYPSYPPTGFITSNPTMQTPPPPAPPSMHHQTTVDMPAPVPVKLEAVDTSNQLVPLTTVTTTDNSLLMQSNQMLSRGVDTRYTNQPAVSDPRFVYPTNTSSSAMSFPATSSMSMSVLSPTLDSSRYLPVTPGPFPLPSPDLFGTPTTAPVTLTSPPYLPSSPPYQLYPHLYMSSPTTQGNYFDTSSPLPMLPSSTRPDDKTQLKDEQPKPSTLPTDTIQHMPQVQDLAPQMPYSTQHDHTRTLDLPMSMGHVGNGHGSPQAPPHDPQSMMIDPHGITTSMAPHMPVQDDVRKEDVWRPY